MSSLPVPLSPRIRTVASVLATCSTSSMTLRIGALSPTILFDGRQLVDGLAQLHVFLSQTALFHRPQHQVAQLVRIDGFGNVVEGPFFEGPHRGVHRGEGGDHDHGGLRVDAVQVFLELHAVHAGHLDVQQHHLVAVILHGPKASAAFSTALTS